MASGFESQKSTKFDPTTYISAQHRDSYLDNICYGHTTLHKKKAREKYFGENKSPCSVLINSQCYNKNVHQHFLKKNPGYSEKCPNCGIMLVTIQPQLLRMTMTFIAINLTPTILNLCQKMRSLVN